ncbi:hypothetical protein [Sphingomonas xinjiangensis]|uniref:Uncharacterized protein n=1 Tax=Sphingomonas xinjiangensis TaxID=643568 RepID=A0A840YT32_9SPHN|nr:hypothetical protein [Sphingomonas xinjiangensis]MBB5712812.1 hypothetical protein [Sphingomonas xinjiangensis]
MTEPLNPQQALARRIQDEYEAAYRRLKLVDGPDRHSWKQDPRALSWWTGDVLRSVSFGAPILLKLTNRHDEDPTQLFIEVRLFWRACGENRSDTGVYAMLRCEVGRRLRDQTHSLLPASMSHIAAADMPLLIARATPLIDRAIGEHARQERDRYRRD